MRAGLLLVLGEDAWTLVWINWVCRAPSCLLSVALYLARRHRVVIAVRPTVQVVWSARGLCGCVDKKAVQYKILMLL